MTAAMPLLLRTDPSKLSRTDIASASTGATIAFRGTPIAAFGAPSLAPVLNQAANRLDPPGATLAAMPGAQTKLNPVLSALIPDALVIGETHGPVIGRGLQGGNFHLSNPLTGSHSYFGSQLLQPLPPIPTPLGPIKQGISLVGTAGTSPAEGGLGYAAKVPTPVGDLLVFVNGRAGSEDAMNALLRGERNGTASVNFGVAYSVSDGALLGVAAALPVPVGPLLAAAAREVPADAWVGVAYRATASFEDGQLQSLKIGDVEIPLDRIGEFFTP